MENIFEELGIPKKYLKNTNNVDRYVALVHKSWLKSLVKHSKLAEFIEKSRLESWPDTEDDVGPAWTKIFIRIFMKRDAKVIPLPRIRGSVKEDPPFMFCQLLQYISEANYKNLWKDAYKKYNISSETNKESQVTLADYNDVLREIVIRIYGCPIVNACDPKLNIESSKQFDVHLNFFPATCGVETLNAICLLHIPFIEHNVNDCISFSPAVLEKSYAKSLFVMYQLLNSLKSLHDRSLTLGDITLNDIYLNDDLWIYMFPQISSNIYIQQVHKTEKIISIGRECSKSGHNFDANTRKCCYCGLKTYDKHQVSNENLEKLCQLWMEGEISNFTYITALNNLSGRKVGDPNCHHVFPWVTDFASRCGKNWRDLKKSKYRLNKGERQLDLTYEHSQTQVPHHVSDVLSSITYYVYMARRTPKSVLCKNVRTVWVPAEYPSSIQRMQEWTPDECIPEFFTDPTVFRSIHEDLDDLEVPTWACSPEEFVERHREILESPHVSERLHCWIDLTFGYKLAGSAAVKAKNVCLHLADDHKNLTKSGIVQLFSNPHPQKSITSVFWQKVPPKIYVNQTTQKHRDRSNSSCIPDSKSDEDLNVEDMTATSAAKSPLGLSKFLSRSRSSLNDDQNQKPTRNLSNQRSTSLGPKNPSFTSHVNPKQKSGQLSVPTTTLSKGIIYLPKEYKPELALETLEKEHLFYSKTFHTEQKRSVKNNTGDTLAEVKNYETCVVQNAFTNLFFDNFEAKIHRSRTTKSLTFPLDNQNIILHSHHEKSDANQKNDNQIVCNYADIISSRRIRELQVLGCIFVEIFMAKQLRVMGTINLQQNFIERLQNCITVLRSCKNNIPPCISRVVDLLLQPDTFDLKTFRYPAVTDFGLPPPSAHLLLEPLLHCIIPFSKHFSDLYKLIVHLKEFENVALELNVLYHFDCDGQMCAEYESLERTKILFAQNIGECKVKLCARNMENLLNEINTTTDIEIVYILLPQIRNLIEDHPTSILAAWYLFDSVAKVLGPSKTAETLLEPILKLYENEPNENSIPYNGKIAKLYHHSFLLRLMVRLGLRCFLDHFTAPLVEAVGGYKDYDKVDFILHSHFEKATKKMSHLKTMDNEQVEISPSDDSSVGSEKQLFNTKKVSDMNKNTPEPEVFEMEEEKENEIQLKSLIEHLELNVASDLPFNHSTAEEALDATIPENVEQLRSIELNLNLTDEYSDCKSNTVSPTIPIPSSNYRQNELSNISCEIGSKKSETDSLFDKKSSGSSNSNNNFDSKKLSPTSSGSASYTNNKKVHKQDVKISDMSADSLVWLSHRLGPVLTARYLSRNLLKMLTLCYVGKENLALLPRDLALEQNDFISIASSRVVGDQNAGKVLQCLANIAGLYGEQLILFQYIPHMSELIALCKRKLTANLEGGLISCLALLKHIIPYLADATLMDQLQDVILKNIVHPTVRLLGSTKFTFPNGCAARNVLARKYLDALYVLSIRVGSDMTRRHLAVPALQRFFLIFDKVHKSENYNFPTEDTSTVDKEKDQNLSKLAEESHFVELRRDGTTTEWAVGGRPVQISHVCLKDSESADSLSPPALFQLQVNLGEENITSLAVEELHSVFTFELAHTAYLPFLKHIGQSSLEISLKNNDNIRYLCQEYEQYMRSSHPNLKPKLQLSDFYNKTTTLTSSGSIGSNIALIGNRIDVQSDSNDCPKIDLLSLVSNRMENNNRHLRGNWLAYWEHEIGRSEKDNMFNFKQIKLQSFTGHANGVKCLFVLDNENSFMSGSRDKTVKLWSLRSQGDGTSTANCQWTYTAHKKSILAITFIESIRLVASCDSIVHIWDPFMGVNIANLESPKFAPVNVLKCMPAPSCLVFAATTEGTIKVIDSRLCNYIHELKLTANPTGLIRCLAISPSGSWIAAGQSSGSITILDTRTGLVISTWRAHESEVLQMVALDNTTIVSSSLDQNISVWNVNDGKFKFNMRGATEPVHCLTIYDKELISATTANRIGVHTSIDADASFSSTKLRSDAFKGLITSMALLPLNRLLLLGADTGNINLLC